MKKFHCHAVGVTMNLFSGNVWSPQLSPGSSYLLTLDPPLFVPVHHSAFLRVSHHLLHPLVVSTFSLVAAAPSFLITFKVKDLEPLCSKGVLPLP